MNVCKLQSPPQEQGEPLLYILSPAKQITPSIIHTFNQKEKGCLSAALSMNIYLPNVYRLF